MGRKRKDTPAESATPSRKGKPINVWLPDDLYDAMGKFIESQDVPPKMSAVIKLSLELFLESRSFYARPKK